MSILRFKEANCKNCYKCIRNCPIKAISLKDNQAQIVETDCVLCGTCVLTCPQNAKQVRSDIWRAKEIIGSGRPVYVSLAPSFIAEFETSGAEEFSKYLLKLGFAGVYETAEGANIVKQEYDRLIAQKSQKVIISSCCHTVVKLIQKYYPDVVKNIAPVLSPMQAHAKLIKERHPESAVVFIGPCISKKDEAEKYKIVDCVLTFEELMEWFEEAEIAPERTQKIDESRYLSRFFPVAGGIVKTMDPAGGYRHMVVDGMQNCINAIKEIEAGGLNGCFVEMSACQGSCVNGPSIRKYQNAVLSSHARVTEYANTPQRRDYDITCDFDLHKDIKNEFVSLTMPGEEQIKKILKQMGKTSPADELNCGTCGYATCREKAVAVYFGRAEISMCLPYMMEKAHSISDKIITATPNAILTVNQDLNIAQINTAACQMFGLASAQDVLGRPISVIMDAYEFANVFQEEAPIKEQKVYLAEYNIYAEETLIYDDASNAVICIMKDITEREKQNEKMQQMKNNAAEIADKVIDKQMRVVQEIASLLGETTAETKVALTKLKNTIMAEEDTL